MITGINHITLSIHELKTSFHFYHKTLGFKPIARWPKGAYFLAGDMWLALLVETETRKDALPEYTHIAFTVSATDFDTMAEKIQAAGATIWKDNWSEGKSLYFLDPNGHKLEIHASDLQTRIQSAKANPWEDLEFFV